MNEYWYYTLSAIPQTLAAMIALAAAFAVYKLNLLETRIQEARTDMRRFILLLTSYKKGEIHQIEPLSNTEFLEWYEQAFNHLKSDDQYLGYSEEMYRKFELEMQRVIQEEWRSFFTANNERIYGYLMMKKMLFRQMLSNKEKSLYMLLCSLLLVSTVIIMSLIALPNYDFFSGSFQLVFLIVMTAVLSVIVTARSVWTIAKS